MVQDIGMDKKEFFLEIQNKIVRYLNDKQKSNYQREIQKIEEIQKKIEYVKKWKKIAERNKQNRQDLRILGWIKKNYPDKYELIRGEWKRLGDLGNNKEQSRYLQREYALLIEMIEDKWENDILNYKRTLRMVLKENEYELIELRVSDIKSLEQKKEYLKMKMKKALSEKR
jgi:hypothetical protein